MTLDVGSATVQQCIEHVGGQLCSGGAVVFSDPEQVRAMLDLLGSHYEAQVQAVQADYCNALHLAKAHVAQVNAELAALRVMRAAVGRALEHLSEGGQERAVCTLRDALEIAGVGAPSTPRLH